MFDVVPKLINKQKSLFELIRFIICFMGSYAMSKLVSSCPDKRSSATHSVESHFLLKNKRVGFIEIYFEFLKILGSSAGNLSSLSFPSPTLAFDRLWLLVSRLIFETFENINFAFFGLTKCL